MEYKGPKGSSRFDGESVGRPKGWRWSSWTELPEKAGTRQAGRITGLQNSVSPRLLRHGWSFVKPSLSFRLRHDWRKTKPRLSYRLEHIRWRMKTWLVFRFSPWILRGFIKVHFKGFSETRITEPSRFYHRNSHWRVKCFRLRVTAYHVKAWTKFSQRSRIRTFLNSITGNGGMF